MSPNSSFKIVPSILSSDFSRLGEEVHRLEEAGADWIHVDVMDGHFVPNITMGPPIVRSIRKMTALPLDVHLMISEPDRYLEDFVRSGADKITVHAEACVHLHRTVQAIDGLGAQPGVALNPSTSLSLLEFVLSDVNLVLLMTVNPGFGGQSFITSMLPKIASLRHLVDKRGLSVNIEVDGGIKLGNIQEVARAGATVFVSGSGILETPDYASTISRMRKEINWKRTLGGLDERGTLPPNR